MNSYRIEHDSMGEVRVPNDKLWGAQTERSRQNFPIGVGIEIMPQEIIHALALIKKACALANRELVQVEITDSASYCCKKVSFKYSRTAIAFLRISSNTSIVFFSFKPNLVAILL